MIKFNMLQQMSYKLKFHYSLTNKDNGNVMVSYLKNITKVQLLHKFQLRSNVRHNMSTLC